MARVVQGRGPVILIGCAQSAIGVPDTDRVLPQTVGERNPKSGGRLLDGRTWDEFPVLQPEVGS